MEQPARVLRAANMQALVNHEASKQYGIYVAKYEQMLSACIQVSSEACLGFARRTWLVA
jgi:hypothetical protein